MVTVYYNPGMEHHVSKFLDMTGLKRYETNQDWQKPVIWMSLYNFKDYLAFKFHEGPKLVYWFGSDVTALITTGLMWTSQNWFASSEDLVNLIKSKNCIHVCQNELLQSELASVGIDAVVRPLYLGELDSFETCFKPSKTPSVYTVVSAGRPGFYGVDWIHEIADKTDVDFHIYGCRMDWNTYRKMHKGRGMTLDELRLGYKHWTTQQNVTYHWRKVKEFNWSNPNSRGRYEYLTQIKGLPELEFNQAISSHQAFLRLPEHDGVSQTVMRALAMGQYVCDRINYPFVHHVTSPDDVLEFVEGLHLKTDANQDIALLNEVVNNFDWLEEFLEANPIEEEDEWLM